MLEKMGSKKNRIPQYTGLPYDHYEKPCMQTTKEGRYLKKKKSRNSCRSPTELQNSTYWCYRHITASTPSLCDTYRYDWVHLFLRQIGTEHLLPSVTPRHGGHQAASSPCLMDREGSEVEICLGAHSTSGSFTVDTASNCAREPTLMCCPLWLCVGGDLWANIGNPLQPGKTLLGGPRR